MIESSKAENAGRTKQNRFLISLLFAAVLLNSLHDFNRVREFSSGLASWATSLLQASQPVSYATNWAEADRSCSQWASQKKSSLAESGWIEPAASDQSLRIKRINRDFSATRSATREIAILATKRVLRRKPVFVTIELVEHGNYGRAVDSELKEETKQ